LFKLFRIDALHIDAEIWILDYFISCHASEDSPRYNSIIPCISTETVDRDFFFLSIFQFILRLHFPAGREGFYSGGKLLRAG
jgi:hypothetical protein